MRSRVREYVCCATAEIGVLQVCSYAFRARAALHSNSHEPACQYAGASDQLTPRALSSSNALTGSTFTGAHYALHWTPAIGAPKAFLKSVASIPPSDPSVSLPAPNWLPNHFLLDVARRTRSGSHVGNIDQKPLRVGSDKILQRFGTDRHESQHMEGRVGSCIEGYFIRRWHHSSAQGYGLRDCAGGTWLNAVARRWLSDSGQPPATLDSAGPLS